MPWQPLPQIAFAIAIYPFQPVAPADLPLELGDELYIIEEGGNDGQWLRGYLVAPPSLLAGLTSVKGQTLEARVFAGIFPKSCVEIREVLGDGEANAAESKSSSLDDSSKRARTSTAPSSRKGKELEKALAGKRDTQNGPAKDIRITSLSVKAKRDPNAPKPAAPVPMLKIGDETPISASEPLVDDIGSCLREWHSTNLHQLLLARQYPLLDKMSNLVQTLDLSRRQFLHNVLTNHEVQGLREKTVWDLVKGNKLLNGEVIVRDPAAGGRVLTGDDSAVEITKLQSMMSLLDEKPVQHVESEGLHHLLIDVKAFVGNALEPTTLVFYLVSKASGESAIPLSESYIVEVPPSGSLTSLSAASKIRTLFTDLASADLGEQPATASELFLVVKVQTEQAVVISQKSTGSRNGVTSRDGLAIRTNSAPLPNGTSKSGRRSIMWGSKNRAAKNAPILNPLAEQEEALEDGHDRPPSTAGSRAPSINHDLQRTSTAQSPNVIKMVGIGALKLNNILKGHSDVERVLTIWSPSTHFSEGNEDYGEGWEKVIRELMESKTGHFQRSRRAERLQVSLKIFMCPDVDELIKATPTLLSGITKTSKMGFSGAPTKPRSDVYITLNEAFIPRHALLSRSTAGATPLSTNISCANLELTLEVRKPTGERIERCIYPSSNGEAQSSWISTASERGEGWNQTIRLSVPPNDIPGCHLLMILADIPGQTFGICYLPLWDQQAFIRDGHHSLLLYKYDETTSHTRPSSSKGGGYLGLKWNSRGKDDVSKDEAVTGPIATLRLQTYLCSTKFSQDKVLLRLLRWKEVPDSELQEIINRLVFVPEIEIVKLLNEVLDAIFGILVDYAGNDEYEDLIFNALVTVLGITHDRRFNLTPLVDHYAETRFHYPYATPCLVRSFTRLLANPADPGTSRKLRATFKVVRHILKFITHARDQQKVKEAGIGITTSSPNFTRHLRSIFKALDGLMRNPAPILVGSQTLAVQHFHTWLPELVGLLGTEEIVHIAIDFMDSCAAVKGKLILYKLVLIVNYSKLELFAQPEQQKALSANTVRWIAPHWGKTTEVTEQYRDQVRLCCSVLSTQIDLLGPEIPDHLPKTIDSYLAIQSAPKEPKTRLSLLFPIQYPFPTKPTNGKEWFDEALIELSAILSAISTLPSGMQLELADDDMTTILDDTLRVHLSILECEAFPSNWLSVHIYHHKSTMKTLEYLASILLESFLPSPDDAESYNTELWKAFFTTLLRLIGSDALALEMFPEQKRRAVWKITGDVREQGAELLRRTWEAIGWETGAEDQRRYGLAKMGGYQVQYIPGLVGPIVELCLSVHEGLRRVAVEVLQTMIVSEWTLSEDLAIVQAEMIDCLDKLFKSKSLSETVLQKLFIMELMELFAPLSQIPDDPLYMAIRDMISTIDHFLDLLVLVHTTDGAGEATHLIHRLRLMEFLRDMNKEEIFIRYVHQLASLQVEARNHTEAGLALRLHADLYDWDPVKILPALADPGYSSQSAFDRKENIYFKMIEHFENGEAWSSLLEVYKELQDQYENNVFDYLKLARTQRSIATVYESIVRSEKLVPKYFCVTYRGMGFPPSLRDKDFIFEGHPNERTTAFSDRMQEQHPSAHIVASGAAEDVEGQYLQISPLSAHRDLEHRVFQRAKVPSVIKDYLLSSHSTLFSITSKRSTTGPVHEHWSEKLLYVTAEPFPTVLRRSEIVSVERLRLNAEQTALERITRKTQEMCSVEMKVERGEDGMTTLLVEALNISCNPTSESSVARYRDLLPRGSEEDDEESSTELSPIQKAIKMALVDHAIMVKRAIAMLQKKSSNVELLSTCKAMQDDFEEQFQPELYLLAPQQEPATSALEVAPTPAIGIHPTVQALPYSMTNGTLMSGNTESTAILNTPTRKTGQDKKRLSFLKTNRPPTDLVPPPLKLNGSWHNSIDHDDGSSQRSMSKSRDRSHRSKDGSRKSFFGGGVDNYLSRNSDGHNSNTATNGHNGYNTVASMENGGGGGTTSSDWYYTENSHSSPEKNHGGVSHANGAHQQDGYGTYAETQSSEIAATEQKDSEPHARAAVMEAFNNNNNAATVEPPKVQELKATGSVRKRFSMFNLGKKKGGGGFGNVGAVVEE